MYLRDNIFEEESGENNPKKPKPADQKKDEPGAISKFVSKRIPDQAARDEMIKKLAIISQQKNAGVNSEMYNRAVKEFNKKKSKYIVFVIFLSIVSQFFYRFLVKPPGKAVAKWIASIYRGLKQKFNMLEPSGLLLPRSAQRSQVKISQITTLDLQRGSQSLASQSRKIKTQTEPFTKLIGAGKLIAGITSMVGGLWWLFSDKTAETSDGESSIDKELTDININLLIAYAEVITALEFLLLGADVGPFVFDYEDPYASMAILSLSIPIGGAGTALILQAMKIQGTRRVPTTAQIGKIFDDAIRQAFTKGAADIVTTLREGVLKGVDDLFTRIKTDKERFAFLKQGDLKQIFKDHNLLEGGFDLQKRIKDAITKSIDEGSDITKEFDKIIDDAKIWIAKDTSVSRDKADMAAELINVITRRTYNAVNDSFDDAVNLVVRRKNRALKRGKAEVKEVFQQSKRNLIPSRTKKPMNFTDALMYRRQRYSEIVKDLLMDWKSLDDDFMDFYYLSGGPSRGAKSFKGSTEPGLDDAMDLFKGQERTRLAELRTVQEELITRYNKQISDLNDEMGEIAENIRKNKLGDDADVITSAGSQRQAATLRQEIEAFKEFKDTDEFKGFLDDVYSDILTGAKKSHDTIKKEVIDPDNFDIVERIKTIKNPPDEVEDIKAAVEDVVANKFSHLKDKSIDDAVKVVVEESTTDKLRKEIIYEVIRDARKRAANQKPFPVTAGERLADAAADNKFYTIVALVGTGIVGAKAYSMLSGANYNDENPIATSDQNTVTGVEDNIALYYVLRSLTRTVQGEYLKRSDNSRKFSKTVFKNFKKLAKSTGFFEINPGSRTETTLSNEIKALYTRKKNDGGEIKFTKDDLQELKNFAENNTAVINKDLDAISKIIKGEASKTAQGEQLTESQINQVIQKTLIILSYGFVEEDNENKKFNKIKSFFEDITNDLPSDIAGAEDSIKVSEGPKWCVTVDRRMKRHVLKMFNKLQKSNFIKDAIKTNESLIKGDRNYLSKLVKETLLEYRQLDNYSKYPYHSEIGNSEEESKDFIEDWKDFELALVRDESRDMAIKLAKILVKDLELFGDVVDLVGKNQSVGTEILKNFKKHEEKS